MGQTTWQGIVNPERQIAQAGTALANSAVATDISPAAQFSFGADGFSKPGEFVVVEAAGILSTAASANPTLLLGIYWGGIAGTVLGTFPAWTAVVSAASWAWSLRVKVVWRAVGASGTASAYTAGFCLMPATASAYQAAVPITTAQPVAASLDTTASKTLTLGATWSSAVASTSVTCQQFTVDVKN